MFKSSVYSLLSESTAAEDLEAVLAVRESCSITTAQIFLRLLLKRQEDPFRSSVTLYLGATACSPALSWSVESALATAASSTSTACLIASSSRQPLLME